MDFSPIYHSLIWLWFPISLLIFAAVVNSAWFKGIFGEFIINLFAKWQLNKDVYHLIKNVTLPTEDGTTQIDHIIVSVYGVFVVETKNLKGWIYGGQQKSWTQKIYKQNYRFQNPLHQNYKHTNTLQIFLNLEPHQLHSLVVFIGDSTFKTPMPENVTYGMGYIRYIHSKTERLLTPKQVLEITQKIESERLARSFQVHRQHARHVTEIINRKENTTLCPKCGAEMLLKQTKKGPNAGKAFWGCVSFPKCRGTRQHD